MLAVMLYLLQAEQLGTCNAEVKWFLNNVDKGRVLRTCREVARAFFFRFVHNSLLGLLQVEAAKISSRIDGRMCSRCGNASLCCYQSLFVLSIPVYRTLVKAAQPGHHVALRC